MPLTLRDVDGFLLRPDAFPDRRVMPRLAGGVHVSKSYAVSDFSDAPWTSEGRSRYLAELTRDVTAAQAMVEHSGRRPDAVPGGLRFRPMVRMAFGS